MISADSPMVSDNLVPITDLKDAKAVLRILEALEDNDDVQDVFSNFDISDELMEAGGIMSLGVGDRRSRLHPAGHRRDRTCRSAITPGTRSCSCSTRATTRRCARSS